jgi:hypothetical protein
MSFYASKVAGCRKYCKNERVCNSLIISNKTFLNKLAGLQLVPNWSAIEAQSGRNSYSNAA